MIAAYSGTPAELQPRRSPLEQLDREKVSHHRALEASCERTRWATIALDHEELTEFLSTRSNSTPAAP